MSTIQIRSVVSDHSAVRDTFAQNAYAGGLPKAQWSLAQDLVGRYDDATDEATRAAIAGRMNALTEEVARAASSTVAPARTRTAA